MDTFIFILLVFILLLFFIIPIYVFIKYTGISLKATFSEINDPKYFFRKNFLLKFSNNFIWKTKKIIIILKNENFRRNIYCYNKDNFLCVIREIDNIMDNYEFLNAMYINFYHSETFNYEKFIEYSNQMGMYIRTYNIIHKFTENEKFSLEKLMKMNNINLEFKKININTAAIQEIINLPFINVVTAKKLQNHIKENGNFKTFWEFAKFLKLNINQGEVLSKLVFVKPVKDKEKTKNN